MALVTTLTPTTTLATTTITTTPIVKKTQEIQSHKKIVIFNIKLLKKKI